MDIKTFSPLYGIKGPLKILGFLGGFPLAISDDASHFKRSNGFTFLAISLTTLVFSTQAFYVVSEFLVDSEDIKSSIEAHVSLTEVIADQLTEWPQVFTFLLNFVLALQMGPKLTQFVQQMKSFKDVPVDPTELASSTWR